MRHLHLKARLQRSLHDRGIFGSLRHYSGRVWRIVRAQRLTPHPFDIEHGVQTTAYIEGSELATGHAHDLYNTAYYASAPSMIQGAIDAWREVLTVADPRIEDCVFIDLGAGLGRVVLVASLYPFRECIGVEMSPRLAARARENIAVWIRTPRPCASLQIRAGDATEVSWPRAPLVIYMFNPFEEPVMRRLLDSLDEAARSGSAPIYVLYVHPLAAPVFDAHPGIQLLSFTECHLTAEERTADLFTDKDATSSWAECRIYRVGIAAR